jgi:hypothetical protein
LATQRSFAPAKFVHQIENALADFKQFLSRRSNHFLRQKLFRRNSFKSGLGFVQMTTDRAARTGWKQATICVRQTCDVTGMASGRKYWFRVAANNAHGQGPWSQPVSARVK